MRHLPAHLARLLLALALGLAPLAAGAVDVQDVVELQGQLVFPAPIGGVAPEEMTVRPSSDTEGTGNGGTKCSIVSVAGDLASVTGAYPSAGSVHAEVLMEKGGPQLPEGGCLVDVHAVGWDGAATTARGTQTVLVDAAMLQAGVPLVLSDLVVRASQAVAGIDDDCRKWVKKQLKARDKCNALILKKGPEVGVAKCKDAGPAPPACDPGLHVEALLALAHGLVDQQVDPAAGSAVDASLLKPQLKCQKTFGKAAWKYAAKRLAGVEKRCVRSGLDSVDCREAESQAARKKLDAIDKCEADVAVDGGTGLPVPDVGLSCDACFDAGTLDRKCLKECFATHLDALVDGIVGDVPVCGDGILQGGEFCDDGNATGGDGCSALCGLEG